MFQRANQHTNTRNTEPLVLSHFPFFGIIKGNLFILVIISLFFSSIATLSQRRRELGFIVRINGFPFLTIEGVLRANVIKDLEPL